VDDFVEVLLIWLLGALYGDFSIGKCTCSSLIVSAVAAIYVFGGRSAYFEHVLIGKLGRTRRCLRHQIRRKHYS